MHIKTGTSQTGQRYRYYTCNWKKGDRNNCKKEYSNKKNIILDNLISQSNKVRESLLNIIKTLKMRIVNDLTKEKMKELQIELSRFDTRCKEASKEIGLSKKEIITFLKKVISREHEKIMYILINSIKITNGKLEIIFNYSKINIHVHITIA